MKAIIRILRVHLFYPKIKVKKKKLKGGNKIIIDHLANDDLNVVYIAPPARCALIN